jgi:diacylglycerol O-acyltransferase
MGGLTPPLGRVHVLMRRMIDAARARMYVRVAESGPSRFDNRSSRATPISYRRPMRRAVRAREPDRMPELSSLDSSFLRVETPTAHMHVGWLSHLDLPDGVESLDVRRLVASIAARLHRAPRFRQRVMDPPLGVGEPEWIDDPSFAIVRHVAVAAAAPTGRAELRRMADDFLSVPLPRDRPLWKLLVVPRVGPDGAAILGKVHHAMVDGVAAVELGMLLFDVEPDARPEEPPPWTPRPAPGVAARTLGAIARDGGRRARAVGSVVRMGASPREGLRSADSGGRAAVSLAGDALRPAGASFLNPEITPARTLVTQTMPMDELDAVKRERGVKLNDVVLALASGALRQLAHVRGEEPADVRVMVPVSTRAETERGAGGNRITFCFMRLPVTVADPLERLRRVHATTAAAKRSGRVAGSELLLRSLEQLPSPLKTRAAKLAASPRLYNLTVSNVPGPPVPLYAAGAQVSSAFPVIPLSDGHALSIGVLSYHGSMHFAGYADPVTLPEARELPALLSIALVELLEACERRPTRRLRREPAGVG